MTPPGEKDRDLCRARGTLFSDRHVSCRHDGDDRKRSTVSGSDSSLNPVSPAYTRPRRRGENELVIPVVEAFGGWGLIARLEDLDGITVEAASP